MHKVRLSTYMVPTQFINIIIFILCCLILVSCDKKKKFDYPPLAKYFPSNEQYPQGYSDVIMGDSLMRVPGEISKQVSPDGHVSIYAF